MESCDWKRWPIFAIEKKEEKRNTSHSLTFINATHHELTIE